MAALWRDPLIVTFIDSDNRELGRLVNPPAIPRVGENVRLGRIPYLVERVGYDIPDGSIARIWIVCEPA